MRASYGWLRSLCGAAGQALEASPHELAERLTRAGVAVDEVSEYGAACPHVLVAAVKRVEPHPTRSGLRLVTVAVGAAGERRVVCGAPNVPEPGAGLVVLALPGTTLPGLGITVGERAIGGVASPGILVSERELGLVGGSGKGDGILVLAPDGAAPGTPLAQALPGCHDFVLTLDVTPNRADVLCHVGLAREVCAVLGLRFAPPAPEAPARVATNEQLAALAAVTVEDTERCPHYGAAAVVDVKVGPSPAWLRYRLESLGVRAISNAVDVSNLVLLEFGQPIHCFDLDQLSPPSPRQVVVRRARAGEELRTLDGIVRKLDGDDLVIADRDRPVALAGVMGGADSEITDGTRRILVECAHFFPRGIRRTSRRHGLASEASHRFERGVDPRGVPDVLGHTASLLTQLCGAAAVPGMIVAGVAPPPATRVRLRAGYLKRLLGIDVAMPRAGELLGRLGCVVHGASAGAAELTVEVPSHRFDLHREADLVEEVMRLHGIDEVPTDRRPLLPELGRSEPTSAARARQAALDLGLSEALTFGFVAPAELELYGAPPATVRIVNPLGEERSVMRTSLLPGLFAAVGRARRHGVGDVRLFTLGRLFLGREAAGDAAPVSAWGRPAGDMPSDLAMLPFERHELALVMAGERRDALGQSVPVDVYDAKGAVLEVVERVSRQPATVRALAAEVRPRHLHPRAAGGVYLGDRAVARFGELHPELAEKLGLAGSVVLAEIDVCALAAAGRPRPRFRPIPTLPAVSRDVAFVVRDAVTAGEVATRIRQASGELCESVELFDLFRGQGIPDGHRSLAFHIVFRDPKAASAPEAARTLTDAEVDACYARMLATLGRDVGAVQRG
ncbi:MAG: phenylalanine--tRNA ligase subunit beta [Myxococcales bacterium]|nr:phenylalanine--tRNA ligase subunit beta [Myxococcales bacterium]